MPRLPHDSLGSSLRRRRNPQQRRCTYYVAVTLLSGGNQGGDTSGATNNDQLSGTTVWVRRGDFYASIRSQEINDAESISQPEFRIADSGVILGTHQYIDPDEVSIRDIILVEDEDDWYQLGGLLTGVSRDNTQILAYGDVYRDPPGTATQVPPSGGDGVLPDRGDAHLSPGLTNAVIRTLLYDDAGSPSPSRHRALPAPTEGSSGWWPRDYVRRMRNLEIPYDLPRGNSHIDRRDISGVGGTARPELADSPVFAPPPISEDLEELREELEEHTDREQAHYTHAPDDIIDAENPPLSYFVWTIAQIKRLIMKETAMTEVSRHNADPESHTSILVKIADLATRIGDAASSAVVSAISNRLNTHITNHPAGTELPAYEQTETEVLHSRAGNLFWEGINEVPDTPGTESSVGHTLTVHGTDDEDFHWAETVDQTARDNAGAAQSAIDAHTTAHASDGAGTDQEARDAAEVALHTAQTQIDFNPPHFIAGVTDTTKIKYSLDHPSGAFSDANQILISVGGTQVDTETYKYGWQFGSRRLPNRTF